MSIQPQTIWLVARLAAAAGAVFLGALVANAYLARPARAQSLQASLELSRAVELDEPDNETRHHLARANEQLSEEHWDEAIETLQRLIETQGGKVVALSSARYVNLAAYCHMQLAALPPEALVALRRRIDPQAAKWYQEGIDSRSSRRLQQVVEQFYTSSSGDDALWALGEIALEQGHFAAARGYWEQLIETPPERIPVEQFDAVRTQADTPPALAKLLGELYVLDDVGGAPAYHLRPRDVISDEHSAELVAFWKRHRVAATRLAYPDSHYKRADVRARLTLASIMELSLDRAEGELAALRVLHPDAEGRLAGRTVKYTAALEELLREAHRWPAPAGRTDWPTFAGSFDRNRSLHFGFDVGERAWPPIPLGQPIAADSANDQTYRSRRVAEDARAVLSCQPIVVGRLLLFSNERQIFAFDVRTGKPAWPAGERKSPGEIYRDEFTPEDRVPIRGLGAPRFTLTAASGRLYARLGTPFTNRPAESRGEMASSLLAIDLGAEGRLAWKIEPGMPGCSFEGSAVAEGSDVYIALRSSAVRPRTHVACYDAATGRLRWRTLVVSAETPGGGRLPEITHNLLTLAEGTIYYNTNLGAVAALDAGTGRLKWVSLYPRARDVGAEDQASPTVHFFRDLNPCVYFRGRLMVAPSDTRSIFALDANTGQTLWQSRLASDVVHLLGVGKGSLVASGKELWWIDAESGKVLAHWPGSGSPTGYGRGLLAGGRVYWPTREAIYAFDQKVSAEGAPVMTEPPVRLAAAHGTTGGNLVPGPGVLLVAAPDHIDAFACRRAEPSGNRPREADLALAPRGEQQPAVAKALSSVAEAIPSDAQPLPSAALPSAAGQAR